MFLSKILRCKAGQRVRTFFMCLIRSKKDIKDRQIQPDEKRFRWAKLVLHMI
jgi:hypothetical protein